MKRILVPLDMKTDPDAIARVVADAARGAGATIRLLHVAPVPDCLVHADGRIVAYASQEGGRVPARRTTMLVDEMIGSDVLTGGAPTVRDRLCIDRIRRSLRTDVVGFEIHLFDAAVSTSDVMRRLAEAGARDGAVVLAEADFAVSILVRRPMAAYDVPCLMFVASVALVDALASEGIASEARWPSRVVADARTVAETDAAVGARNWQVDYVILSVHIDDALDVDRNRFVAEFLNGFERWLAVYTERGAAAVLSAWKAMRHRADPGLAAR